MLSMKSMNKFNNKVHYPPDFDLLNDEEPLDK